MRETIKGRLKERLHAASTTKMTANPLFCFLSKSLLLSPNFNEEFQMPDEILPSIISAKHGFHGCEHVPAPAGRLKAHCRSISNKDKTDRNTYGNGAPGVSVGIGVSSGVGVRVGTGVSVSVGMGVSVGVGVSVGMGV